MDTFKEQLREFRDMLKRFQDDIRQSNLWFDFNEYELIAEHCPEILKFLASSSAPYNATLSVDILMTLTNAIIAIDAEINLSDTDIKIQELEEKLNELKQARKEEKE